MKGILIGVLAFAILGGVFIYNKSGQKQNLDIVQIFDQFLLANHAASKCIKPEKEQLYKFLVNFKAVWLRTAQELKKRNPDKTEEEIGQMMKARSKEQNDKVGAAIEEGGCGDPRVKDLLKRFEIQSSLKFG